MNRLMLVSATVVSLLSVACASAVAVRPTPASVAGLYDTKVTRVEGNCPLGTEDAETEVTVGASPSVVLLRHGGTTYGGRLEDDGRFRMGERTVQVDGIDYHLAVVGRFTAEVLDARVTVTWGSAPACRVIVKWHGPRRMG